MLYLAKQEELDEKVDVLIKKSKKDFSLIFATNVPGGGPSWTGSVHFFSHEGIDLVVKAPRFFSSLLNFNQVLCMNGLQGYHYDLLPFSMKKRLSQEEQLIDVLYAEGLPVPQPVFTNQNGVVLTEYVSGTVGTVAVQDYPEIIDDATQSLSSIHEYIPHGDPLLKNVVISDKRAVWLDFTLAKQKNVRPKDIAEDVLRYTHYVVRDSPEGVGAIERILVVYTEKNPSLAQDVLPTLKRVNTYHPTIGGLYYGLGIPTLLKTKFAINALVDKLV